MKSVLFTFLKFLLFLVTFAIGSFLRPLNIQTSLNHVSRLVITRYFIWDGLLIAAGLYALLLLLEVLRKRLRTSTPWTTLAFVLAIGIGLVMKLGFVTLGS
jgi:hypothetical protein